MVLIIKVLEMLRRQYYYTLVQFHRLVNIYIVSYIPEKTRERCTAPRGDGFWSRLHDLRGSAPRVHAFKVKAPIAGHLTKCHSIFCINRSKCDAESRIAAIILMYGAKFVKCTSLKTFCLRLPWESAKLLS